MKRLIAVVVMGALALSACSGIQKGKVYDKWHEATSMIMTCHPVGKSSVCAPIIIPEEWVLEVHEGSETGYVHVERTVWRKYKIGQQYP